MANPENKQIPYESTQKDIRDAIESVATAIGGIAIPSADHVSYDNSGSGLSATDVQNALDEIVSDIPTVNDGTLTIQQNGEAKGTFTANQSGNSTVNIETPTTDIQTAVDEFETYNGGLLSSLKVTLSPNQDLHGYENPWVGGAGKNKLQVTMSSTTSQDITATVYDDGTVLVNGTSTGTCILTLNNTLALNGNYILSGCPSGGDAGTFRMDCYWTGQGALIDSGNGVAISPNGNTITTRIVIMQGVTVNNQLFKPMIRLSTESDATFEPYSNICPISGHTQVEVEVSDGQTTQEQVTVNLGGTYYSGTLDVVSGVFTVIGKAIDLGDINWTYDSTNQYFYANALSDIYRIGQYDNPIVLCEGYKPAIYQQVNTNNGTIGTSVTYVKLKNTDYTVPSALKTSLVGIHLCYPLDTPTPIQLSPTMVKALVGENHLSAPLEGQEITESKYKQMFTFDDVNTQIESTYSEGISHNSVYRGKYLGDHVTDEQWDAIGDGSFRDLYIGDYWAINGINWRIAHFNYWLGTGDVKCNTNHVVIVPYGWVSTFNMNATDDTTGGYLNSEWYTTNRHFAVENIEADFGASHILSHRNFFSDAVSDGHASHGMWVDSTVDLMNEIMVCGSLVGSYSGKYYEVGCDKFQLALFKYNPPSARMDVSYWLRGVSTASSFVAMGNFGLLDGFTASQILKIRPVFAIKK